MEGYRGGLKGYWKRKQYQRLDGGEGGARRWKRRPQHHRVELAAGGARADGSGRPRRRRFWRIKVAPRLGFLRRVVLSPGRLLARIRDAYVRMMMRFANSRVFSAGGLGYYGGDAAAVQFTRPALKEYDEKVIVEIYKSLMAQGHLVVAGPGGGVSQGGLVVPRP